MKTELAYEIETPELVVFEFELAGTASRALAWCIDAVLILFLYAAVVIAALLLGLLSGGWLFGPAIALAMIAIFLLQWGYFALFEWRLHGQTPGKRAMGLRVLQENGVKIGFQHSLVRNLLRMIDSLPFQPLVGGIVTLFSERRQRLGDMVAGTVVVHERSPPLPSVIAPPSERYNSLLEDPGAAARARALVDSRLRELMTALALRREALEVPARLSLFGAMATHLEGLGLRRPAAISDERFVLGVTAAVLDEPNSTRLGTSASRSRAVDIDARLRSPFPPPPPAAPERQPP